MIRIIIDLLEGSKMMLSDRDLKRLAINNGLVEPFIEENCEGATINITLADKVKVYNSEEDIIIGKKQEDSDYDEIDISDNDFYLEPGCSALVQSQEYFRIPINTSGQVFERYSLKLLGLQISPASYLNPGYEGTMTFVAFNQSSKRIRITPGIKFCQLALNQLTTDSDKPYRKQGGKYLGSRSIEISKLHLDREIQEFLRDKGVENVSPETASELGKFLMKKIEISSDKIADELREKFGDPNVLES